MSSISLARQVKSIEKSQEQYWNSLCHILQDREKRIKELEGKIQELEKIVQTTNQQDIIDLDFEEQMQKRVLDLEEKVQKRVLALEEKVQIIGYHLNEIFETTCTYIDSDNKVCLCLCPLEKLND